MTSFGAFGEPGRPDDDYAFPDEPSTTVTDPRVAAVLDRLERNPRLAVPFTWKWRTNVACLHLLLAFALHRVATRVVIAEAREMIDTIDVHALGLGDGDAGQYTMRQHLVACAQACAWVALLAVAFVAELTSAGDALVGRHAWTPCAFHDVITTIRIRAFHAAVKSLAVLFLSRLTATPVLAVVVAADDAAANKVLVVAKLAHLCAAWWIVRSIASSVTAIRAEWSATIIPAAQRPGGAEWKRTVKEAVEAEEEAKNKKQRCKEEEEDEEKDEEKVLAAVIAVVSAVSGLTLTPDELMAESGMDSLTAVELRTKLEATFGVKIPIAAAFEYPTARALAGYVARNRSR